MATDKDGRNWTGLSTIGVVVLLAVLAAGGFWLVSSDDSASREIDVVVPTTRPSGQTASTSTRDSAARTTLGSDATDRTDPDGTDPDGSGPDVAQGAPTIVPTSTEDSASATTRPASARTSVPTSQDAATTTTNAAPTTDASASTAPGTIAPPAPFPTTPQGAPLPIVAVFDTDTITITGYVPSEAARERLTALALANSKTPARVVDNMIVDPAVPIDVGVRVIEMNSVRFPEGTARIEPEHAKELDRIVGFMNALPNVSVLVVGHADQRGTDADNFAISDERARAVVNYFRFMGISPTRLSSRAAGAIDLLTLNNDAAAFALNRRTEFVFTGLLVG